MTSTTAEIMPIIQIDKHIINHIKPGQLTRLLQKQYNNYAQIKTIV